MIDPISNETTGFHLFFEPEGALKEELSGIIHNLSSEFGGPVFTPHITLLARIEGHEGIVREKTQELAHQLAPFTLTLDALETKDAFFKALCMQIQEPAEIEKFHALALNVFAMQDEEHYIPHLSLLYGNYAREQKEKTLHTLRVPQGKSFLVDCVHLYQTEGTTEHWRKLETFTFGT